ncbi:MAG TPA: cytochrome C [Acetobacteraceae bacterium]|jgi:hypothetical protein|nr:cytochrome C [Acetobacteraceae bacterium]
MRTLGNLGYWLALPAAGLLLSSHQAEAIPAFAAQTGQPCTACHIGAFGPQLTPLGRAFKIGGYTQKGGDGVLASIPLSLMIQGSFNHTGADQNPPPQHYGPNNNFSLDQVSGFIGGAIGDHTGGLIQFTWSDVGNNANLDNTDLRPYTTTFDLGGKELRVGTTINNNPTVQDPYNTTYAWGFPYIASQLAPSPAANPMLAGGLSGSAFGYTAYAWYDNKLYLEGGLYSSLGSWAMGRVGNNYGIGATTNPAPYLRAAYEWQWGTSAAHVGALYMHADVSPATDLFATSSAFGTDHYSDYSVDAGYQFLGDGTHIATVQTIFTHEDQNLLGSANMNGIAGAQYSLNQIRADVSYWYKNTYGVTLGWQNTWGPANPVLFAAGGSANDKPNSNAFTVEADWVPFGKEDSQWAPLANLKLGVQYTAYTQFNGGSSNYDGLGTKASDNNTLLLFAWFIF